MRSPPIEHRTAPRELELQRELLSKSGYDALAARLGPPQRVLHQTNISFDSPDGRWRRLNYSPRLRRENEDLFLTLKGPGTRDAGLADQPEWEQRVTGSFEQLRQGGPELRAAFRALIEAKGAVLPDALNPAELGTVKGSLENTRQVFQAPNCPPSVHLELDHTRYPDRTESYIVEVEVPEGVSTDDVQQKVDALLEGLHVEWRPSPMGKRARFEQAMNNLEGISR